MKLVERGNPEEIDPSETIVYRNKLGSAIVRELQAATPVGEDGVMVASWRFELTDNGVKVINDSGYAPAVEFGTPSPIVPKNAPALSFYSQGQWWVLASVSGQPGQYFVRNALQGMFPGGNVSEKQ